MTDAERREAIERIRARRGFWVHLTVYLVVNAGLVLIWYLGSGGYFWPVWPLLGWGIGLAAHGFGVFVGVSPPSEERIQREIDRGRRS
ncbi:2TM domain-containing protein [Gordonia rhizosphera]|uniref:2TM domain-containing protein n=1 Tax=Gordonia rhizosphera NBRC 16068 TaxID=1108045 RepID=K6V1S0_9ACTN|nr:2TM domain-containing protein [Gordonia rhizosphera]GAB89868.1 hypothetical protein GORHZ_073_00110 [Gordonia rhizosphera NBRC 16068]